jgi:hypothetical protein
VIAIQEGLRNVYNLGKKYSVILIQTGCNKAGFFEYCCMINSPKIVLAQAIDTRTQFTFGARFK